LKPKLLQWLDEKQGTSFENAEDLQTLLEVEKALNMFPNSVNVVLDWILEELKIERKTT
jgi:hypothetical protein